VMRFKTLPSLPTRGTGRRKIVGDRKGLYGFREPASDTRYFVENPIDDSHRTLIIHVVKILQVLKKCYARAQTRSLLARLALPELLDVIVGHWGILQNLGDDLPEHLFVVVLTAKIVHRVDHQRDRNLWFVSPRLLKRHHRGG
jgi:hypothetical protein